MKSIQYTVVVSFFCGVGVLVYAREQESVVQKRDPLEFIDQKLEDFINRVVLAPEDKELFKQYYNKFAEKYNASTEEHKEKILRYLYTTGLSGLEKKHDSWYKEVAPFLTDARFTIEKKLEPTRDRIRRFLSWYGIYQEFAQAKLLVEQKKAGQEGNNATTQVASNKESKESENPGMWQTIKEYVVNLKGTIISWFGFGKVSDQSNVS